MFSKLKTIKITELISQVAEGEVYRKQLLNRISDLEAELRKAREDQKDPRHVVEAVMGEKIKWYDYKDLTAEDRALYWKEAQMILQTHVFQNEKFRLFALWSDWALRHAKDFEGVRDMRHQVSGIELFIQQLEEIESPVPRESTEEVNEAI